MKSQVGIVKQEAWATSLSYASALFCQKSRQLTVEREAMSLPLLVSAAINRFDGSLDLGEDAQFVGHV